MNGHLKKTLLSMEKSNMDCKGLGYVRLSMDQKGSGKKLDTDQKGLDNLKVNTDQKSFGKISNMAQKGFEQN